MHRAMLFSVPVERHFIVDDNIVLLEQCGKNLRLEVAKIRCLCDKLQVPLHKILARL
jgi:hypothetical protein